MAMVKSLHRSRDLRLNCRDRAIAFVDVIMINDDIQFQRPFIKVPLEDATIGLHLSPMIQARSFSSLPPIRTTLPTTFATTNLSALRLFPCTSQSYYQR
jgi:hypothetical protein